MKRLFLFTLIMALGFEAIQAQNENEQVLVFRNTGEVNLLYSNKIDSIVCSYLDKDSLLHDDIVSQIFYTQDTTMIVPISEIDSVAFGQRNVVDFKDDVIQLSNKDLSYIIRYDGEAIYYRIDTPSDILPSAGQKLFYGEMDDIFPIGLCAKVTNVEKMSTEIKVSVSDIGLEEVFEELFFAGRVQPEAITLSRGTGARSTDFEIPCKIDLDENGSINMSGHLKMNTEFVVRPLKHYYYANIITDADLGFDIALKIDDEFSAEDDILTYHFPNIAAVLHPQLSISSFIEINAEVALNYSMRRFYHHEWEWTRDDGKNTFKNKVGEDSQSPQDKAKIDVTCDGNIYLGPQIVIEFNILSAVGTRAKIKLGPEISSEVSMEVIEELSKEYNPELYAKGEINFATKLRLSGHTFRKNILTGEETEYNIFNASKKWGNVTHKIFPDFKATKAVEMKHEKETVTISTATISTEEIIRDVETGFQIELDTEEDNEDNTEKVLEQIFVETIVAETDSMQGIDTAFVVPETKYEPEKLVARPIFKYAGRTILADKAKILTDDHIQPLVALMTDGVNTVLSGYPMIGSSVIDSTNYNIGNYMPVPIRNSAFGPVAPPVIGIFISSQEKITLAGTWIGEVDGKATTITFNEDMTGRYEQNEKSPFKYRINYPQVGDIVLNMDDSTSKAFVLYSLTNNELILKPKKQNIYYTFTKQ